jgi:hypothetical protein
MFLYLLNEKEGRVFMELAIQAMNLNGTKKDCRAEYATYLAELDLADFEPAGLSFDEATAAFDESTIAVKRSIIIELCGILYSDKEIDEKEIKWIYEVSGRFGLSEAETGRLVRWSKDFSDFLEIGLMYINAES